MKPCPRSQWSLPAKGLSAINFSSFPRICVSSTSGGGGKTLLSLGLARLWQKEDVVVKPFKKGPDYIDAAWLGAAAQLPATNLDPFFMSAAELSLLFRRSMLAAKADVGLIEGNRGLFDGLDETGICSTAQVARALSSPLLLCLDCSKATRTISAILNGLASFEDGLSFAGVVLNRAGSSRHESSLRRSIEANTAFRVLGCLPRLPANPIAERHMGLSSSGDLFSGACDELFFQLAGLIRENCDSDAILAAARAADPLALPPPPRIRSGEDEDAPEIGVVRDKALWFYYPENLDALREAGARLVFLSLFDRDPHNHANWERVNGLYLGGGFPEDYIAELVSSPYLRRLKHFSETGMPIYAECGGLIILSEGLEKDGSFWPLAGVLPAVASWHGRPQGLGYVEACVNRENPWFPAGLRLRGHEFHYSRCMLTHACARPALRLERGSGFGGAGEGQDCLLSNNTWASYMHIFAPVVPLWARSFVDLAITYKRGLTPNTNHLPRGHSNA